MLATIFLSLHNNVLLTGSVRVPLYEVAHRHRELPAGLSVASIWLGTEVPCVSISHA